MSNIKDVVLEKENRVRNEKYEEYVDRITPKHRLWVNVLWAFFWGGTICLAGQGIMSGYMKLGANKKDANLYLILTFVAISVILTGLGIYSKFVKYAGAGAIVPITGFANSVASSAGY